MFRPTGLIAGPVTEVFVELGIRLEFLAPAVALASMGIGIVAARLIERRR
ncbi:MAG: hypothetical protein R3246_09770 [Acidimicrobiia bacterium]|nr:hypothetical protein [Acidimicrobiia bacterium]